uniref:Ionotropic glutamate receptor C-terminal domain-containing protein n=1 Tax=Trichogramma kaykai TaxID=54128 RepID=A0ABD2WCV8_9HYME
MNPWGRQRSKNFSLASALWVMWGLLCGHLVAFKAPKSWPNKFLINVWGGFSVIFVASYTANIAALIAGLFFHNTPKSYDDRSLLQQHVGAPKASAAEYYVQQANPLLWSNMARHSVPDVSSGVTRLLNGSLDVLIADTPILDYYRATDNGCRLENFGEPIKQDTYAVALSKGHPMRESISQLIANYTSTGLLDILQEKWYGGLPCIPGATLGVGYDGQPRPAGGQPRPLGVASVAGVFCLLGLGMFLGVVILIGEHIFYRYSLPKLRQCSKDSVWRSRNVMFFSQKLYRFINCVELVSPHHAARELVHTVRQGQITSLFQKSVKRKEHEQRRRRKSKAQFFEMIQEIRRAQQEERQASLIEARGAVPKKSSDASLRPGGVDPHLGARELLQCSRASRSRSRSKSPMALSPRRRAADGVQSRSSTNLTAFSIEQAMAGAAGHGSPMKPREFTLSNSNLRARSPLEVVGRRLSHGDQGESPPPTPKLGGSTTTPYGPKTPQSLAKMPQLHQQQQQQPQPQYTRVVTEPKVPQIVPPVTAIKVTPKRGESLGSAMPPPTPKQRSPTKRGQSFPVFTTLKPQMTIDTRQHYQVSQEKNRSPLLSPSELTSAIGRKLSREWGSGEELGEYFSKSHEHLGAATSSSSSHHTPRREPQQLPPRQPQQQQTTATPRPAERQSRRKRTSSQGDAERERPVRRARSHENKEHRRAATAAHFDEALLARYHQAAASHQQQQQAQSSSSSGGMSQRAKRQLESELKAILTARAHHLELHPP